MNGDIDRSFAEAGLRWRLLTYIECKSPCNSHYWLSEEPSTPLFLDSGAYSAHTMGLDINIDDYCYFIKSNPGRFNPYASLDVIGDWKGSAANHNFMVSQGLTPLPTFHLHSPMHELRRLLKENDYVALGGLVGCPHDLMVSWLDRCWAVITDCWPKRIHGFGVMKPAILLRYPWYSSDGTTAVLRGGMGLVQVFDGFGLSETHNVIHARATMNGAYMDTNGSRHVDRRRHNVVQQLNLERYVTDVWRMRGIAWS